MKRLIALLLLGLLVACSTDNFHFSMEKVPTYKPETTSEIVIKVEEDGSPVTGLQLSGSLEMEKMDHGIIEVNFNDQGDGTYVGEVELPMGGEWIIDLEAEKDENTYEDVLIFDVNEG